MATSTDIYGTTRAIWEVIKTALVQAEGDYEPEKIVASFYNYQDCYVFMKGLAVAQGLLFKEFMPDTMILKTKDSMYSYKIQCKDIYLGNVKI